MRVLVIVDAQKDFISGALGSLAAKAIIPHMAERVKEYSDGDTLILFTKDTHDVDYFKTLEGQYLPFMHCVEGTPGWSLVKEISTLADGYSNFLLYSDSDVIRSRVLKNTFGSIKLCEILKKHEHEIESVTFMGFCTDVCVVSNVLMARAICPIPVSLLIPVAAPAPLSISIWLHWKL